MGGMSAIAMYLSQFSFSWDDEKLRVVSKLFEQGADPLQTLGNKKIGLGHLSAKSPGVNMGLLHTFSEFGADHHLKDTMMVQFYTPLRHHELSPCLSYGSCSMRLDYLLQVRMPKA